MSSLASAIFRVDKWSEQFGSKNWFGGVNIPGHLSVEFVSTFFAVHSKCLFRRISSTNSTEKSFQ